MFSNVDSDIRNLSKNNNVGGHQSSIASIGGIKDEQQLESFRKNQLDQQSNDTRIQEVSPVIKQEPKFMTQAEATEVNPVHGI